MVGSIAKSVIVVNPGVKGRVACSDTSMHGVESLEGVAKGHNGGEGIGRVRVAGGGEADGGEGREEGGDGGPVGSKAAGKVGEASGVSRVDAKAAMVAKGQGCAVEGAVGLVGRRRMRAYDRGEGRADDGIVRTGGGIGRGRWGELEPVGGGYVGAVPKEKELTLGGGINLFSVMHTLKAGKVRQLFRDHGTQLVRNPPLVAARVGTHYLKATGG